MNTTKDKISIRQAIILLFITTLSPAIRLFPQLTAKAAGKAGWLAPVVAIIPVIILIYIVNSFFKKNKSANLSDVYCNILGKIAGKIVISLTLIWILILLALYVRYYSERLLSSMMPNISNPFLIIVMLCLVFFATRKGLVSIARASEIFLAIFIFIFIISFIFVIPEMKYSNLMNVSYLDAWPIAKASYSVFAIWGYFLYIFFFADKISGKENIKRFSFRGLILLFFIVIMLLIMTIGSLGSTLTSHVALPFFLVIKNISIGTAFNHLESISLAVWIISDFIIISTLTLVITSIIKSLFKLSDTKPMVSPVLLFAGIGAMFLFKNRFELETFSKYILPTANVIFEFVIPILIFGIGKIRKKI